VNAISKDGMIQEFHFKLMELTFFQFGIKSNFSKKILKRMYMVFMVLHVLQEKEDVINVANYEIIQVLTKNIVHRMLKDNT
jgi:hypothetical protein